jgi:hypothetical protein
LLHFADEITVDNFSFGWYVGGGARFANRDVDGDDDKSLFGPRGSIGLNFPLSTSSGREFDVFAE